MTRKAAKAIRVPFGTCAVCGDDLARDTVTAAKLCDDCKAREDDAPYSLHELLMDNVMVVVTRLPAVLRDNKASPLVEDVIEAHELYPVLVKLDVEVAMALAYIRGAAEALDMTIGEMFDEHDVSIEHAIQIRKIALNENKQDLRLLLTHTRLS